MVFFKKIANFYIDGFKEMKLGKRLWAIVLIKLFIMFFIIKLFIMPNYLNSFSNDLEIQSFILDKISTHKESSHGGN